MTLLLDRGANVNAFGAWALSEAALHIGANAADGRALIEAACGNHIEATRLLLERGANVGIEDAIHQTSNEAIKTLMRDRESRNLS
jgi:ankyrin repeat protein